LTDPGGGRNGTQLEIAACKAVAETIAFAIAQPDSVDIGAVIVRPTVQP